MQGISATTATGVGVAVIAALVIGLGVLYLPLGSSAKEVTGSSLAPNGILLTASVYRVTVTSGKNVDVSISFANTLPNVSAASDWALPLLKKSPPNPLPGVILIFQGDYLLTNISSATPLLLHGPGIASYGHINVGPLFNSTETCTSNCESQTQWFSQYYDPSVSKFVNFSTGVYTVAVCDEWGSIVLLHFTVV